MPNSNSDNLMLRSILFAPADDTRKMSKAYASQADGLIFDLEDSVTPDRKSVARDCLREFLSDCKHDRSIWVRINSLETGLAEEDLQVAVAPCVAGIIFPKVRTGEDVKFIDRRLQHLEKAANITQGPIRILPIATETPEALFHIQHIATAPRVWGISWGAEDLAAAIGAFSNKQSDGSFTPTFEYARTVCLLAARAANIEPIDAPSMIIEDNKALNADCMRARTDGFSGKFAIHPIQLDAIHRAFTPTSEEVQHAAEIVAAFKENPNAGVLKLHGKMIDAPHLKTAQNILRLSALSKAREN